MSTAATPPMDLWEAADEARKRGMEAAARTSGEEWGRYADRFIRRYLRTHSDLHVDDLWGAGLEVPPEERALGKVIAALAREGVIAKIAIANIPGAFAARASVKSNGQVKLVWNSMVYEGTRPAHATADLVGDMRAALETALPLVPTELTAEFRELIERAGGWRK